MDLSLTTTDSRHTLDVRPTIWSADTQCIALMYDDVLDTRTPALTADEARRLAIELLFAANDIENEKILPFVERAD